MYLFFENELDFYELFFPSGTYKDGLAPDGKILSDHMLLGSVVATILIIDNTSQVI